MDFSVFRTRLKNTLEKRGYSQNQFSIEAGIAHPSIARYLSGKRTPDLMSAIKIANKLNVTLEWLLGLDVAEETQESRQANKIANLYSIASENDKLVIDTILAKYDA